MSSISFGNAVKASIEALRQAVEAAFVVCEAKTDFPLLRGLDGGAPSKGGGDVVLYGTDLLQGCAIDSIDLSEGDADLVLHALKPGDSGITVEVVAGEDALAIGYDSETKKLTITLASGGSSDDAVATAINADAAQTEGIIRAVSGAGGDLTANQAVAPMTGGTGDYDSFGVYAAGTECLPANETGTTSVAKWTDTKVTVTVPNLGGESTPAWAQSDLVQVRALCNGAMSDAMTAVLGA